MLNELIKNLSNEVGGELVNLGIPADKTGDVMDLAKTGLMDQFKTRAENNNLGDLLNLFNGKQDIATSPLVENMTGGFAAQLGPKIGVFPQVAQNAANYLVPTLLSKINAATPATGLNEDNVKQLLADPGGIAGVMDKVKGMFT
jgi:hypothetical protein